MMPMMPANDAHDAHGPFGPGIGMNCSSRLQAGAAVRPNTRPRCASFARIFDRVVERQRRPSFNHGRMLPELHPPLEGTLLSLQSYKSPSQPPSSTCLRSDSLKDCNILYQLYTRLTSTSKRTTSPFKGTLTPSERFR